MRRTSMGLIGAMLAMSSLALAGCGSLGVLASPSPVVASPVVTPAPVTGTVTTGAGQTVDVSKVTKALATACKVAPTFGSISRVAGEITGYSVFGDATADVTAALTKAFCPPVVAGTEIGISPAAIEDYAALKKRARRSKKVVTGTAVVGGKAVPVEGTPVK